MTIFPDSCCVSQWLGWLADRCFIVDSCCVSQWLGWLADHCFVVDLCAVCCGDQELSCVGDCCWVLLCVVGISDLLAWLNPKVISKHLSMLSSNDANVMNKQRGADGASALLIILYTYSSHQPEVFLKCFFLMHHSDDNIAPSQDCNVMFYALYLNFVKSSLWDILVIIKICTW